MKFFLFCCIFAFQAAAQDNIRPQLFADAEAAMNQAKSKNAAYYAEKTYVKGLEFYRNADEDYRQGGNLEDIRQKLRQAGDAFARAMDISKRAEVAFSRAAAARADADSAGAPRYSSELWNRAEESLHRAVNDFEGGDADAAKKGGPEAESIFRSAELEAIKTNFLAPSCELLKRAEDVNAGDNAPKTLDKAKKLSAQVESILRQNRYDADEARQSAQAAKYEAAHALYLNQTIAALKKSDESYEDAILTGEMHLSRVAGALGLQTRFDAGYDAPVAEMIASVKQRDSKIQKGLDSIQQLNEIARRKDDETDNLRQQISSMEKRLGSLTESEKQLQSEGKELERKLILKQQQEETIRQVAATFNEEEGNVLRDGDNIIIRLYGLSFPVGKSTIETQYYPLLTRVQEAIRKFPNCKVAIEGHTDSQGSDEANQTLSELRAKGVAEYLMANMNVSIPINSQGYGESRPVARNDTPEGRAKNRRIDVVITPEWAK